MKFLHTSDLHLGHRLGGVGREKEFEKFFKWLVECLEKEKCDCLMIAGDIFDTGTPSHKVQEMYYSFLCEVAKTCCKHVIVIGGNHDSPSLLNAPKEILKYLKVHVVGCATENKEDEIILLKDQNGNIEMVVCAVPYLRDKDVRITAFGESFEEKSQKLREGIENHYVFLAKACEKWKEEKIPIVATGHLFVQGGEKTESVRDVMMGGIEGVPVSCFENTFDYVALGHLHVPQKVGGKDHIRYSGSALAMGFDEISYEKKVIVGEWNNGFKIKEILIPIFQSLVHIKGKGNDILQKLNSLEDKNAWIKISSEDLDLEDKHKIEALVKMHSLKVIKWDLKNSLQKGNSQEFESLEGLDENDVFEEFLNIKGVEGFKRKKLIDLYKSIVLDINEECKE